MGSDEQDGDKTTVIVSLDELSRSQGSDGPRIPVLRICRGTEVGRHYLLNPQEEFIVGRSSECAIVTPDSSCSRKHAQFFVTSSGQVFVKDLGSTNGTCVKGVKISGPTELHEDDTIQVGDNTEFAFELMREEEAQAQIDIYINATRDALTKTYNRRFFEETLKRFISQRNEDQSGLALIIFDIDHFKKFNDTHGHPLGDAVLREVGSRVPTVIRGEDIFARIGGEEFAVILRVNDEGLVRKMAERIREAMAKAPMKVDGKDFQIHISVGSCFADGPDAVDFDKLYKTTDTALYKAKNNGRNRCEHSNYSDA